MKALSNAAALGYKPNIRFFGSNWARHHGATTKAKVAHMKLPNSLTRIRSVCSSGALLEGPSLEGKRRRSADRPQDDGRAEVPDQTAQRRLGRVGFLARSASLVAFSGVMLAPWVAAAQDEPEAPRGGEEATSTEAEPQAEPETGAAESTEAEAVAPEEAAAAPGPSMDETVRGEIVVTGYRKSLSAALNKKKRSTGQVDAIVAEDMADFPDQNLAESLQRIPGVAIERSNGEGSRITVRGLGAGYTRTRINGMDARAAVNGNSTRSFDFNMFASELFNSIVVHKTATAELGEGSLGAVVDLNTARPFDYGKGFTVLASAQGGFNDLSQTFLPRLTGLISYHDPSGIWGASGSVAYSRTRLDRARAETVRWAKARFRSVNGVPCQMDQTMETDPNCAAVTDAFHARIPRYGFSAIEGDRLGFTAGAQLRPFDQLEVRLDGTYASYDNQEDFQTIEVLFRNLEGNMDITSFGLKEEPLRYGAGNNTLVSLGVNNAHARSESFRQNANNDFGQLTLSTDIDFTTSFYANIMGGMSRSNSNIPHATTLMYDDRDYNGFSYDFADDQRPVVRFAGPDVTDPANFTLTELRDSITDTEVAFDVAKLQMHWQALDAVLVSFGGDFTRSNMETANKSRNGQTCSLGIFNCDTNGDGMNDVLGPQGTVALSDTFEYPGDVGAGSNTRWAAPSIDGWVNELGYYNVQPVTNWNAVQGVEEKVLGAYLQASGEVPLGNMRFLYDAGVRYARTYQTSTGYTGSEGDGTLSKIIVERDPYNDVLPSANVALWITEDVVARLAGARVLSRPALGSLTPGATVSPFALTVRSQNPFLDPTRAWTGDVGVEWYFAPESALVAAGFVKSIDSFPTPSSRQGTYASTGQPNSAIEVTSGLRDNPDGNCANPQGCWEISTLGNGPSASVVGMEAGFQAPFSSLAGGLPVVLRDMGFMANYTFVHSETPYDFGQDSSGNPIIIDERLAGLSTHSVNTTLYYDDEIFSVRASLAWRSQYIDNGNASANGNLFELNEPPPRLDMSASYNITDALQVNLEALNLTNAGVSTLVDIDARRRFAYEDLGRTFFLGARYTFEQDMAKTTAANGNASNSRLSL